MILTGSAIQNAIENGDIDITPYRKEQLGPNSYDLRLSKFIATSISPSLDAKKKPVFETEIIPVEGYLLLPGQLYLMATQEVTQTSKYVPCIEGRSSIGRLGINVHATAGFGDIGFHGTWTLEVSCVIPVRIYSGMRICQIYFFEPRFHGTAPSLYNGKYFAQGLPRTSDVYLEQDEWHTGGSANTGG
jgi:dCTP deaminase